MRRANQIEVERRKEVVKGGCQKRKRKNITSTKERKRENESHLNMHDM